MFKTNSDRLDYSKILLPPPGFQLELAVGTTYSLDLDTLIAVSIALGLAEDVESESLNNPISMLYALQRISEKVLIFCESGQILMPKKVSKLSLLLEKMIIPVELPKSKMIKRYPSFHPKTWTLQYVNDVGERIYRFVVLSRNLTFDRSWDVSFVMDGSKSNSQLEKTKPIIYFLQFLRKNIKPCIADMSSKRSLILKLCKELEGVSFTLNSKEFGENFEILPLGIGTNSYNMNKDPLCTSTKGNRDYTFHELVVMSPFFSSSVIESFNKTERGLENSKRTLITRRNELSKLNPQQVDNFNIYVLKDTIIDGEEHVSDEQVEHKQQQDIHAKVYLRMKYSQVDLYLGSMNASHAALNANVELMVKLTTTNRYLNSEKFLTDLFGGTEDNKANPFEIATVTDDYEHTSEEVKNRLEDIIKEVCRINSRAHITEENDKYNVTINFDKKNDYSNVKISPLLISHEMILEDKLIFHGLDKAHLSEFYKVTVSEADLTLSRVIMIPTQGFPDDREKLLISSIINDRKSFIEYVSFVLGDSYLQSILENNKLSKSSFYKNEFEQLPALYEKMLRTALDSPERIKDIGYLLSKLSDDEIIPEEFRELYSIFKQTLKL